MKFQIFCVVWAIFLLTVNVSSQTPVCHCNISNNLWLVGSKPIRSNVTIKTTSFRSFFGLHHEFTTFRGVPQKWYTGRLHPEVGPLNYSFIYRFWQKRSPFRIPSIDKWYPFHTPSIELCIPFYNCKCIVFKISWINNKTRKFFLNFFTALRADVSKYRPEVYKSEKSKILKKIHKVALGKLLT